MIRGSHDEEEELLLLVLAVLVVVANAALFCAVRGAAAHCRKLPELIFLNNFEA